jgi:hypothetical protein
LNLVVGTKTQGQLKNIAIPFVNCNTDHYAFLGEDQQKKFENRLCPEEEAYKKFAAVKGAYADQLTRTHTFIEIITCDRKNNPECRPDQETDKLLEGVFFTVYAVEGKVQLRNEQKPYDPPVFYVDTIKEQLQVKRSEYKDNI